MMTRMISKYTSPTPDKKLAVKNTLTLTQNVKRAKVHQVGVPDNNDIPIITDDTNNNNDNKDFNSMQLLSKKALSLLNTAFSYDRQQLSPGILHFSTGNFHRAHQAGYYHDLFEQSKKNNNDRNDLMWGVRECSVRGGGSYTEETRPALEKQDYLYTIVELDDEKATPKITGSIIDMLPYQNDHKPIKDALMQDETKIVSMTVTEGGYFLNPTTNEFDPQMDAIQHDIQNPEKPNTVFGLIVNALKKRRDNGQRPFTVMSCDNVPGNGKVCQQATVGLAKEIDTELGEWIERNVNFPNSMVDRITPEPTKDLERDAGCDDWEYKDDAIIFCEPFRQWVCEDKFCFNERPPLERVGVKFVDDVAPYENMKLRILNGGHASLCYPAALLDIEFVHQAMEHEVICEFVDKLQKTEILPQVPPVPDTDLNEYWDTVRGRYQNSKLSDRIDRNCEQGSDRQPKFIIPSLKDCLGGTSNKASEDEEEEQCVDGLATVSAMWCRYCQGTSESGRELKVKDSIDDIQDIASKAKADPTKWLELDVYGDVGQNEKFRTAFSTALQTIHKDGVEAAMKKYIES